MAFFPSSEMKRLIFLLPPSIYPYFLSSYCFSYPPLNLNQNQNWKRTFCWLNSSVFPLSCPRKHSGHCLNQFQSYCSESTFLPRKGNRYFLTFFRLTSYDDGEWLCLIFHSSIRICSDAPEISPPWSSNPNSQPIYCWTDKIPWNLQPYRGLQFEMLFSGARPLSWPT